MTKSMAAPQAFGKKANDVIFGANDAAVKAAAKYGKEAVTNATIGAILNENEELVCLPTVEKVFRELPIQEIIAYAPIAGLPAYLEKVQERCFEDARPDAYTAAIATAGGTGTIHHSIHNYTEPGDEVLTSDWYWGAYNALCTDNNRTLRTFRLFTDDLEFNHEDFQANVRAMAANQRHVLIILNTPAHNPTGYSLDENDWDKVLDFLGEVTADEEKRVTLLVDVAYLDYAGEGNEARQFFRKFSNLPANLLVVVGYSMSKGFTAYGQRVGAMIGISASEQIITEFKEINQFTSRATWSNINRPAMALLVKISEDEELLTQFKREQAEYFSLIQERAQIFMREAEEVGLRVLPYRAGFFISIPSPDSKAVCDKMNEKNIFLVPLKAGVRIAVCAVPKEKMKGMAGLIKEVMTELGQ